MVFHPEMIAHVVVKIDRRTGKYVDVMGTHWDYDSAHMWARRLEEGDTTGLYRYSFMQLDHLCPELRARAR